MPLEAVEARRLYRQVADQLRALIDSGEYRVGSRLPTERDLAEQLKVSRPTVREALIALEVEGRVRIRVGSGIYVSEPAALAQPLPASAEIEGPFELLRAREFIEGAIAEQAARVATPEDIARIDASVEAMATVQHPGEASMIHDRAFHVAVAGCLDNAVLVRVVGELFDQRLNPVLRQARALFREPAILERGAGRAPGDPRCHCRARSRGRARDDAQASGAFAGTLCAKFRNGSFACLPRSREERLSVNETQEFERFGQMPNRLSNKRKL